MNGKERSGDWQVLIAVALIVLGVVLFLDRAGGAWWDLVQGAFRDAARLAWPALLIGLGALLLIASRHGGLNVSHQGKRLYRSRTERMVGGVLGGLANYLGIDPTLLRIVYVIIAFTGNAGPALLAYVIALVVIPEEPLDSEQQAPPPPPPPPAAPASS